MHNFFFTLIRNHLCHQFIVSIGIEILCCFIHSIWLLSNDILCKRSLQSVLFGWIHVSVRCGGGGGSQTHTRIVYVLSFSATRPSIGKIFKKYHHPSPSRSECKGQMLHSHMVAMSHEMTRVHDQEHCNRFRCCFENHGLRFCLSRCSREWCFDLWAGLHMYGLVLCPQAYPRHILAGITVCL